MVLVYPVPPNRGTGYEVRTKRRRGQRYQLAQEVNRSQRAHAAQHAQLIRPKLDVIHKYYALLGENF